VNRDQFVPIALALVRWRLGTIMRFPKKRLAGWDGGRAPLIGWNAAYCTVRVSVPVVAAVETEVQVTVTT
jgi:hypothetical protein